MIRVKAFDQIFFNQSDLVVGSWLRDVEKASTAARQLAESHSFERNWKEMKNIPGEVSSKKEWKGVTLL